MDHPDVETQLLPEELASDSSSSDEVYTSDHELEEESERIFSASPIKSTSNLLVLQYATHHNLTQVALADLLWLLSIHCPSPNTIPRSVHAFNMQFPSLIQDFSLYYFCSSCVHEVDSKEVLPCPNIHCGFRALSTFIELPIDLQIVKLLDRKFT